MPPLWLIVGMIAVSSVWMLASRVIVRPRSKRVWVGTREIFIPRKLDAVLLNVSMFLLYVLVFAAGARIEGDPALLVLGVVMFAMFAGIAAWSTYRQAGTVPTTEQLEQAESFSQRGRTLFAAAIIEVLIGAAGVAIGGGVGLALVLISLVLGAISAWHAVRYMGEARRLARR
jgi:hypothetical protein